MAITVIRMLRIMVGSINVMSEIAENIFAPLGTEEENICEVIETDGVALLKYDLETIDDRTARIVEALLYNRKQDGLLEEVYADDKMEKKFEVLSEDSEILKGSFEISVDTEDKAREVIRDIFNTANVYDIHVSLKPIAPGITKFTKFSILAVGLSQEQSSMLNKATSTKAVGMKAKKVLNTATTVGYSSAKIIANDVVTPAAEVAAKFGGLAASTAVNATYKAAATFGDEFLQNCNKSTFKDYEPAQRLKSNLKSLFRKNGAGKAISSRSL